MRINIGFSPIIKFFYSSVSIRYSESKEKRGENSDFWFLGRTVRADIFGRIYLGSKKLVRVGPLLKESKFPSLYHYSLPVLLFFHSCSLKVARPRL